MKEKYREIGLTALFLLFIVGMSTDIPAMFEKEEKPQVLAAKTQKPKKTSPTRTPTPTTAWPTWTPTPIESGSTPSQPGSTPIPEMSPAPANNSDSSQPSPTAMPQVEASSENQTTPTSTPQVVGQGSTITEPQEPQFPNDEPGRGGLLDTVDTIIDPLDLPL